MEGNMGYARFTEESNSIDYLEKAVSFIKSAAIKPEDWKWVVLAVHGSLYGFMICNLKGTNPDNVCKGKSQLLGFDQALKRCQDATLTNLGGFTKVLQLSEDQNQALCRLHSEFRNQFVHYRPTSWSIQLDGMPEMLMHVFDALRAVLEMGYFYLHFEPGDNDKIKALVTEGKTLLQKASLTPCA
jgi:hypothetical protein